MTPATSCPSTCGETSNGHRPAEAVGVVVRVAFEDVEVGAAEPDAGHPHDDVARPDDRIGDVADRHHAWRGEDGGPHRHLDER